MNNTFNKALLGLGCCLAAMALVTYVVSVARFSSHMPYMDDYDAVLNYLMMMREGVVSKWEILLAQHNEHRLVFNRLVILAVAGLSGPIDLTHLVWIGNAGWFAVIFVLWLYAKGRGITLAEFLPVVILLLVFSHRDLMTWAMASMQQYFQLLFAMLALLCMTSSRPVPALMLLVVSSFTGGGGMLLCPVFGIYYLLKRQWRWFLATCVVSLATAYCYFILLHYAKPPGGPLTTDISTLAKYVLGFLGSAAHGRVAAYVVSIGLLVSLMVLRSRLLTAAPMLACLAAYIVATALVAGVTRAYFGISQARDHRYTVYSLMMIAIVYMGYLLAAGPQMRRRLAAGALAGATALFVFWYVNDSRLAMEAHFRELEGGALLYPNADFARGIVKKSCDTGLLLGSPCIHMPH